MIIDYEYCSWNTWTYDLAHFLNEFTFDNAHPEHPYIKYYPQNFPTDTEMESLIKEYLKVRLESTTNTRDQTEEEKRALMEETWRIHMATAMKNLQKSCIVKNFFGGIWAMTVLKEEQETEWDIFNWEFTRMRIDLMTI